MKESLHQYSVKPHIYKITDLRNGSMYIGKHDGTRRKYFTSGLIPKRIIKKHGKGVFRRDILIYGDFSDLELNKLEKKYIKEYRTFVDPKHYNLTEGGDGVTLTTKDSRKKLSLSLKRYYSQNQVWNKGKRGIQTAWNKGKVWSEEEKENIFYNRKHPNNIPILQFDLSGNFIKEWKTSGEYCRSINNKKLRSSIKGCCCGKNLTSNGFIFLNKDNFDQKELDRRIDVLSKRPSRKTYFKYDLNGNLVDKVSNHNNMPSPIKNALNGTYKQSEGFIYIWEDDFTENLLKEKVKIANQKVKREPKRKPVAQIDIEDGRIIKIWKMSSLPYEQLGICNVQYACNGKRKSAGGFKWKYVSDLSKEELEKGFVV